MGYWVFATGNVLLIVSCIMFAYLPQFEYLLTARVIQGIGSSFLVVTGLPPLAATVLLPPPFGSHLFLRSPSFFSSFTALEFLADSVEFVDQRNELIGRALAGQPLGVFLGPVVGGLLYAVFPPSSSSSPLDFCVN